MAIIKWIALLAAVCNLVSAQSQQQSRETISGELESRYYEGDGGFYNDQLVQNQDYNIDFEYHDHDEMTKFLRLTTAKYPNLSALYSIGKSVQGNCNFILIYKINYRSALDLFVGLTHGQSVLINPYAFLDNATKLNMIFVSKKKPTLSY